MRLVMMSPRAIITQPYTLLVLLAHKNNAHTIYPSPSIYLYSFTTHSILPILTSIKKMCLNASSNGYPSSLPHPHLLRPKLRLNRLTRWRRRCKRELVLVGGKTEMELKNLKLYLENRIIIEENAELRKKATLLQRENQALMLEYQKKFPHLSSHN